MEAINKYLSVQFDNANSKFCEILLHQTSKQTIWNFHNRDNNNNKICEYAISLQSITLLSSIEAIEKFKTVYGVIGICFGQDNSVYFMVMCPTNNSCKETNIFFVKRKRPDTEVLSKKCSLDELKAARLSKEILHNIVISGERSIIVDFICKCEILDSVLCDFYIIRRSVLEGMLLIGVNKNKIAEISAQQYDLIVTGRTNLVPKSQNQMNRKEKSMELNSTIVDEPHQKRQKLAYMLPQPIGAELFVCNLDEDLSGIKKKQGLGIKKVNANVALVNILGSKYGKYKKFVPLSEMHCTKEVEGAFCTEHSVETIVQAIDALNEKLIFMNVLPAECEQIRGAVASKLLEDIGWRLGPNKASPKKFKNLKVDIDQTTLVISKLNLVHFNTPETLNIFLGAMFIDIMQKVITKPDILQDTFIFSKQDYMTFAKLGGHTYMSSKECCSFTRLVTSKNSIFKVSVRLRGVNFKNKPAEQEAAVWDAMTTVMRFIETKSTRSSVQGEINADLGLNTTGNILKTCVGPMLPLLTCVYLASSIPDGVDICMESYNTKAFDFVDYIPVAGSLCSREEAERIVDLLTLSLTDKVPMLLDRASRYFHTLSRSNFSLNELSDKDNELIWGVGCTVETWCELPKTQEEPPEDIFNNNNGILMTNEETVDDVEPISMHLEREFEPDDDSDIEEIFHPHGNEDEAVLDTVCPIASKVDQLKLLISSFGHDVISSLSLKCGEELDSVMYNYEPGYTVIQVELPPFVQVRNDPKQWFAESNCSKRKCFAEKNLKNLSNEVTSSPNKSGIQKHTAPFYTIPHLKESIAQVNYTSKNLLPSVIVKCLSHLTYADHGGTLPFEMQPMTITCKNRRAQIAQMMSKHIERIMLYNVASRLAFGEWNTRIKYSNVINHINFDIAGSSAAECVFNFASFSARLDIFNSNNIRTLRRIENKGSAARIEVAFRSPSPDLNRITLIEGVLDVVNTCLTCTTTYRVKPILKLTRFCLSGVIAKMKLLELTMSQLPDSSDIYDELLRIRPEVGAICKSWYSGRGRLISSHIPSPKNSAMACRIILAPMSATPHTERMREATMRTGTTDYYSHFTDNLIDVHGAVHVRVENPMFTTVSKKDVFTQRYVCGKACDKCWKVFDSAESVRGFHTHSCSDAIKGTLVDVTSSRFRKHHASLLKRLNYAQSLLLKELDNSDHNVFLTGLAGTGKSFALKCVIQEILIRKGMYTFAVISPTKVAAGIVNGVTYHSFLRLGVKTDHNSDIDCSFGLETNKSKSEITLDAQVHAHKLQGIDKDRFLFFRYGLQYLFVDEAAMMSHDQFLFLEIFLRTIRSSDLPFGGIRIILCGDALQLPPLVKQTKHGPRHPTYFFESDKFLEKESQFVVIYLKENHRQSGEKNDFARVLNNLRDGEIDDSDLTKINNGYGKRLKLETVLRVFNTLVNSLEEEIDTKREYDQKVRQSHRNAQFNEKMFTNKQTIWYSPYDTLIYRMTTFWNTELLYNHIQCMYPPHNSKLAKKASAEHIKESSFYVESIKRFKRLLTNVANESVDSTSNDFDDGCSFVISMENVEITSIVANYASYRKNMVEQYHCPSKDVVEGGSIPWKSEMSFYAQSQTKLESMFKPSLNLKVFYTDNNIDKNVANNGLGKIIGFGINDNEVEYITVVQCMNDTRLKPHPINIYRKTRTLLYTDSITNTTVKLTRSQFPLKAADSGTPYTVQGITLTNEYIFNNFRLSLNDYGRVYVSLSRASSEDLVFCLRPLVKADIKADPVALKFDKYHRNKVGLMGGISAVFSF